MCSAGETQVKTWSGGKAGSQPQLRHYDAYYMLAMTEFSLPFSWPAKVAFDDGRDRDSVRGVWCNRNRL